MNDQAMALRQLATQDRPVEEQPLEGPPVFVMGSGKGGVGKSVLSVIFASAMARRGQRVLLLDGSQNMGNLHVLLGVPLKAHLEQLFRGEIEARDLIHPVAENLWLVPAESGAETLYSMAAVDRARLHHRLSALYDGFDAVVVDGGSGIESVVRLSTMRGTRLVVATIPEPPALTDAYALIKIVHLQLPGFPVDVLVNRARDVAEGDQAFERLATASSRFLSRTLGYVGSVPEISQMRDWVRQGGGLIRAGEAEELQPVIQQLLTLETRPRALEPVGAHHGDTV
jgi:flagellar biosynthesis protein FlhG